MHKQLRKSTELSPTLQELSQINDPQKINKLASYLQSNLRKRVREGCSNIGDGEEHRKKRFVDEVPNSLQCHICKSPFQNAVIVNGCGHEFCLHCLKTAISVKPQCPICCISVTSNDSTFTPSRRTREIIDEMLVHCDYEGCTEKIGKCNLEEHMMTCKFSKSTNCKHHDLGCAWTGRTHELNSHLNKCVIEENQKLKKQLDLFLDFGVKRQERTLQALKNLVDKDALLSKTAASRSTDLKFVNEKGETGFLFKSEVTTNLGLIIDYIEKFKNLEIILTCDGPFHLGGTIVKRNESLFDLGLSSLENIDRGATLFYTVIEK